MIIHEPGIYFGLPKQEYHDDPALGSSDIKMLRQNPTTYWHRRINPHRTDKSSRPQDRGTAMHVLLFDGDGAFDRCYSRGPTQDPDATPAEKGALTKAANAAAAKLGKKCLLAEDYDRVVIAHHVIRKNPDTATAFSNGIGEVSVFWERHGVRLKARIDYLKVAGIGDLKGVSNEYDIDFPEQCRVHINRYRYDIQAAHYLDARSGIAKLVADGAVHGDHDVGLLKRIAARVEKENRSDGGGWQWVFYCTVGAPDAFSYKIVRHPDLGNTFIENARRHVLLGIVRYRRFKAQFGDEQWILIKRPEALTLDMMPPWFGRLSPDEVGELQDFERTTDDEQAAKTWPDLGPD